jgi:hypothetical protein
MELANSAAAFRDVVVEAARLEWRDRDRPLVYTCHWCGGDAFHLVSRTSQLTGNRYTDYACSPCARKWIGITTEQRSSAVKSRWSKMPEGRKEQFLERVSEARIAISSAMSLEERRRMTAKARAKRWSERPPKSRQEKRVAKREYMRQYRSRLPGSLSL